MSRVRVRPHVRRPPIGVRLLNQEKDNALLVSMYNEHVYPRSTSALVDIRNPDTIIISYPGALGEGAPEDMERIVNHEVLHATLGRIGEREASLRLDSMRPSGSYGNGGSRTARHRIEESGLYKNWPKWRR